MFILLANMMVHTIVNQSTLSDQIADPRLLTHYNTPLPYNFGFALEVSPPHQYYFSWATKYGHTK